MIASLTCVVKVGNALLEYSTTPGTNQMAHPALGYLPPVALSQRNEKSYPLVDENTPLRVAAIVEFVDR
ncbi:MULTISPECIES: hypothetical protein [unclassified Arthrobacter]|uniref:hypothetical protein n=1 Tax=unclassified Arthrobacter TaxID=235627 RepID=UPI00339A7EEB